MFLSKLFKKSPILFEANVEISEFGSSFNTQYQSEDLDDAELILFGLLVYSRFLINESSEIERNSLIDLFIGICSNYTSIDSKDQYLNYVLNVCFIKSKSDRYEDSIKIKMRKAKVFYLDISVIKIVPQASVVYTTFHHLCKQVKPQSLISLIEGFALVSRIYQKDKFKLSTSVSVPNMIVYELLPFEPFMPH